MYECNIDESTKACKCSEDRFNMKGEKGGRKIERNEASVPEGDRVEFSYHTSSGWTPANKKRRGAIIYPCTNQRMVNSGACFFFTLQVSNGIKRRLSRRHWKYMTEEQLRNRRHWASYTSSGCKFSIIRDWQWRLFFYPIGSWSTRTIVYDYLPHPIR